MAMAANTKSKKPPMLNLHSNLAITLFFIVVFTIPALLLLHTPSKYICTNLSSNQKSWSGDIEFSWNKLTFNDHPATLKIAVFTQKWPTSSTLHYSQFSLESLDRKQKLIELGSRNFFVCPEKTAAEVNRESGGAAMASSTLSCSKEAEKATKKGSPWLKFMDFFTVNHPDLQLQFVDR